MKLSTFDSEFGTGRQGLFNDNKDELSTFTKREKRYPGRPTEVRFETIQPDKSLPPVPMVAIRFEKIEAGERTSFVTTHPLEDIERPGGLKAVLVKIDPTAGFDRMSASDEAEYRTILACIADPAKSHRVPVSNTSHWSDSDGVYYNGIRATDTPVDLFNMTRTDEGALYSFRIKNEDGSAEYADVLGEGILGNLLSSATISSASMREHLVTPS